MSSPPFSLHARIALARFNVFGSMPSPNVTFHAIPSRSLGPESKPNQFSVSQDQNHATDSLTGLKDVQSHRTSSWENVGDEKGQKEGGRQKVKTFDENMFTNACVC